MAVIVVAGAAAGLIFAGPMFGLGVLFGGLLGFGNYLWLNRVTRAMFQPDAVTSTGLLAALSRSASPLGRLSTDFTRARNCSRETGFGT